MPLPILKSSSASSADVVRLFHQTERDYVRHLSEETALDFGTAFHNAELKNVWDANCILDAALPESFSPADAIAQAKQHFESVGSVLRRWVMNPSSPDAATKPLADALLADGWVVESAAILRLQSMPALEITETPGVKIIPSRASYRHARELAEEGAKRWNEPTLADAAMLHLDDPHWDSLLALRDGKAVAHIAVLAVGEIGRIDDVFVSETSRRQGLARTMMMRALEICRRSLFKHVLLCVGQDNSAAQALYASFGFVKIGLATAYHRPRV